MHDHSTGPGQNDKKKAYMQTVYSRSPMATKDSFNYDAFKSRMTLLCVHVPPDTRQLGIHGNLQLADSHEKQM